jgi:GAF domain-containing protein
MTEINDRHAAHQAQGIEAYMPEQLATISDDEGLNHAARISATLSGCESCVISLIDATKEFAIGNCNWSAPKISDRALSIQSQSVDENSEIIVEDALANPAYANFPLVQPANGGYRFFACFPIRSNTGDAIGALTVLSKSARSISEEQKRSVRGVALIVNELLGTRRIQIALSQSVRVLEDQSEILTDAAKGGEIEQKLDRTITIIETHFPRSRCAIILVTEDRKRLRVGSTSTIPPDVLETFNGLETMKKSVPDSFVVYRGQSWFSPDISQPSEYSEGLAKFVAAGIRAYWSVPFISSEGMVLGTILVTFNEVRKITEEEDKILNTFSGTLSSAIWQNKERRKYSSKSSMFQEALELAGFSTWTMDFDGKSGRNDGTAGASNWNFTFDGPIVEVFGAVGQEPLKKARDFLSTVHPEDKARLESEIAVAIERSKPFRTMFRVQLHGGQVRDIEIRGLPDRDIDTRTKGFTGVIHDVTDRTRQMSMSRLRTVNGAR